MPPFPARLHGSPPLKPELGLRLFGSWILQILPSEILDVPVSVETGFPGLNVDFYNIDSSFDYGGANDWDAMSTGTLPSRRLP